MLITSCRLLLTRWSSSCSRISRCSTAERRLASIRCRSIAMPSRFAAPCRKAMSCSPNSPSSLAVDLEHAVGVAVTLQDHVHRAADAVLEPAAPACGTAPRSPGGWRSPACRCAGRSRRARRDRHRRWPRRRCPAASRPRHGSAAGSRPEGAPAPWRTARRRPSAASRAVSSSSSGNGVPLSASTPSSASSSCCRTRWRSSLQARALMAPRRRAAARSPARPIGLAQARARSLRRLSGRAFDHAATAQSNPVCRRGKCTTFVRARGADRLTWCAACDHQCAVRIAIARRLPPSISAQRNANA